MPTPISTRSSTHRPLVTPPSNKTISTTKTTEESKKPQRTLERKKKEVRFEKEEDPEEKETRHNFQRRFKGRMAPGGSVLWTAQRILEEPSDRAVGILKLWIHPKREAEATEQTVALLNDLSDYDVVQALTQLKEPKKHIRGRTTTRTNQLNINVIAETTTDGRRFVIKSLLDCGSTGSAVD